MMNNQDIINAQEKIQEQEAKEIVVSQIINEVLNEELVSNALSIIRHRKVVDKLIGMADGKEDDKEITALDEQIKKYEFDIKKRTTANEDLKEMLRSSSTLTEVMELLK